MEFVMFVVGFVCGACVHGIVTELRKTRAIQRRLREVLEICS